MRLTHLEKKELVAGLRFGADSLLHVVDILDRSVDPDVRKDVSEEHERIFQLSNRIEKAREVIIEEEEHCHKEEHHHKDWCNCPWG